MKKIRMLFLPVLVIGLTVLFMYQGGYELKLVPNEPELRPKNVQPDPKERTIEFALAGGSERENRGFPQREILDLTAQFPGLFYREGPTDVRKIALTFDDGPDATYTPQILDILKEHKIKATFFLIGSRVGLFPEVVERMKEEGHIIGNHSMTHANIIKLGNKEARQEVLEAEKELQSFLDYRTALFRSPYGSLDAEKIRVIEDLGYKIIAWNVDSLDWKSLTAEQVKTNILENVRAGSIILQHSAGSQDEDLTGSVAALSDIIVVLKNEGYQFVTVPELLDIPYKQ